MPRKEYDWSQGPAELAPHSLAKHTILREYVERYVWILTRSGSLPRFRVTLVDGFAGGGEYVVKGQREKIHDGSPIILINAVRAAEVRINSAKRKKPIDLDAQFVFVEKKREAFAYLEAKLAKIYEPKFLEDKVRRIHGSFNEHIWDIVGKIRAMHGPSARAVFVLDQYGYGSVPIDMIARLMSELPNAEVFLTLAVDHISAFSDSLTDARERLRSSLHIDPKAETTYVSGRGDIEELHELPERDRTEIMLHIQVLLHDAFATQAGAKCYTPFFITSPTSHRSYWFLHLANNPRANDVVKDLHWSQTNHFKHFGRPGTKMFMLGFDPSKPSREQLSFDFDDSARSRTVEALVAELPDLLREKYRDGVTVKDLYAGICNDTPASKEILGQSINELTLVGEFKKVGAHGEERGPMTQVKDDDLVRFSKQGALFSIPDLRKKR